MDNNGFDFKHIFYAGLGAVAITAEKARELVGELVEKGEMTIEQGGIIDEELKSKVGAKIRNVADAVDPPKKPSVPDMMGSMSREELAAIKAKLMELEKED